MKAPGADFPNDKPEADAVESGVEVGGSIERGPEASEARYELVSKLGEGGAGAVFIVRDRETGERLALKRLLKMDTESASRIKREFRSVTDLNHPNLIKVYELARGSAGWFFTMELVDGVDLMMYLSSGEHDGGPANLNAWPAAESRVFDVFRQLASGVHALHSAGMLHRDLKPSNVLVADGRVIVLDFGLVHEFGDRTVTWANDGRIAGTPGYMAPEQVGGGALTPAADWYAFGVMLYEAFSGCLPYDGSLVEVLRAKLERDPAPLDQLAPHTPAGVCELCMALLRRTPADRPTYEAIVAALGPERRSITSVEAREIDSVTLERTATRTMPEALFGRSEETAKLTEALAGVQRGRLVVTHVRGPSGAGKSALIGTFLDRLEHQQEEEGSPGVLVLKSRCYEREAMPYKALDGLIDALVQYLERERDVVVGFLLPTQLEELVRVFPALERVRAVQRLLGPDRRRTSATQERTQAESALRELLKRLASHRPVVLWIDDLQWGDLDSASILKDWIETLQESPVLLLLSYRGDERSTNACLSLLSQADLPASGIEHEIELSPLEKDDVEAMCTQRLGSAAPALTELVHRIVEEAQGSPFFASQLLTLAEAKLAQGQRDLRELSVDGIVSQASRLVSEEARSLLALLAISDRPMPMRVALKAAGIRGGGRSPLHELRALRLTRTRVVDGQQLLEIYHDRVRAPVLAALDAREVTHGHASLLRALESMGMTDPEWMHVLALGAGEPGSALRYGLFAAERADNTLAFERSVELYQRCIELSGLTGAANSGELWFKLATALGVCRYGSRAAKAYLEAARRGASETSVELMRLAATHLIRSGRFEEGEELANRVLTALGLQVPETEAGLYAAIGWERLRLRVRGMRFSPRERKDAPPHLLATYTTYAALSVEMQALDPLRAALFQARCMRIALETGVPQVIGGALCAHAISACLSGSLAGGERAAEMLDRAQALAGDDMVTGSRVWAARGICALLLGRPAEAVQAADKAVLLFRKLVDPTGKVAGEDFHRVALASTRIGALLQTGRTREAIAGLRAEEQEARAIEDRTASLLLALVSTIADQAVGKLKEARERLIAQRAELPKKGFGPLHLLHTTSVLWVGCVDGNQQWAHEISEQDWPRFLRSVVRRSAYLSTLAFHAHARFLLTRHVREQTGDDPADLVRSDLRDLSKLPPHLSKQVIVELRARIAYLSGQRDRTEELLREHIALCSSTQSLNEGSFSRYALGYLVRRRDDGALLREGEQALRQLGFEDPALVLQLHFPELVVRAT